MARAWLKTFQRAISQAASSRPVRTFCSPASSRAAAAARLQQRFYFGGSTYNSWGAVPDKYKVDDPLHKDPSQTVVPIFKFTW